MYRAIAQFRFMNKNHNKKGIDMFLMQSLKSTTKLLLELGNVLVFQQNETALRITFRNIVFDKILRLVLVLDISHNLIPF